jgi:urea carboxylase
MFHTVLIANRGAIACRIIRTLRRMGIRSVAVYSDADADSLHVRLADEAIALGDPVAARSYLDFDKILNAAKTSGAQAIHPGYGFLSENAAFASACAAAGLIFIGPRPEHMTMFGLKHEARRLAEQAGVPMLTGSPLLPTAEDALAAAATIGYPVMLKSTAGGGGIGMSLCPDPDTLTKSFAAVSRMGSANFGNGGVFLERAVSRARHIEVQIFGDGLGRVLALTERDCSTQRRNQKVIEESPAPRLTPEVRASLLDCARRLGESASYASAGTVEFLYDDARQDFFFLEVNTRLQVEHGVTEEIHHIDLVEWMILQAAGELTLPDKLEPDGHSIQVRLYAEDPHKDFQPSTGLLTGVSFDPALRIETWVERGTEVSAYYDPMLAKLIATAPGRSAALAKLSTALAASSIHGIETNLAYLRAILDSPAFAAGTLTTRFLATFPWQPVTFDVLDPGLESLVVDEPGRIGYWHVGVPPSGPMDPLNFRLGNKLLGNPEGESGLEITAAGPTLRFNCPTRICLTGADLSPTLDGQPIRRNSVIRVAAGQVLKTGSISGPGQRAALLIAGGIDVPTYLGSKTTFALGKFGGHGGRRLLPGDVIHLTRPDTSTETHILAVPARPVLTNDWTCRVLYGPHGAPDFFTDEDIATFFSTAWEVHYHSARTGVRLIGPKPVWARQDGGEAGLHPSNLHDNAYSIGAIDFTGDMPVILGPDGPSLGGFVCPATIISADLWIMGQLKPGDRITFTCVSEAEAVQLSQQQDLAIRTLSPPPSFTPKAQTFPASPLLGQLPAAGERPAVVYRQSGDRAVLVEYGPMVLDIDLRFRVHALMTWLEAHRQPGILEITPGIRSLQIRFEHRTISCAAVLALLRDAEDALTDIASMAVPASIVHLPLSWDDPSTRLAIEKYQSVRKDAPWCPSNIEFIRRINGLDSIEDVYRTVFDASYLVMGLGDVYLGAPVATPIDPRHRLVTTKYNPARTWTPENAVGIGGAYLCVYGMEGPGGYQFVGRTVPMWNRFRVTADFPEGTPWLLRFFDQIRFYPVSETELTTLRRDLLTGNFKLNIEETTFSLATYRQFLAGNKDSIAAFKTKQQSAFEAERERWRATGQLTYEAPEPPPEAPATPIPPGSQPVYNHIAGNLWKILVTEGQTVTAGQPLLIIESMKMEITLPAPAPGRITAILCRPDTPIKPGQALIAMEAAGT